MRLLLLLVVVVVAATVEAACPGGRSGSVCQFSTCGTCGGHGSCLYIPPGNQSVSFPARLYAPNVTTLIQNKDGNHVRIIQSNGGVDAVASLISVEIQWTITPSLIFAGRHLLTRISSGSGAMYLVPFGAGSMASSSVATANASTFLILPSPTVNGSYNLQTIFGTYLSSFSSAVGHVSTRGASEAFTFLTAFCNCSTGYAGGGCEFSQCGNGVLNTTTGICVCSAGYQGPTCYTSVCQNLTTGIICGNRGDCVNNACVCPGMPGSLRCEEGNSTRCLEGWTGLNCATRTCLNPTTGVSCSGKGVCMAGGYCNCTRFATGPTCRTLATVGLECSANHTTALTCSAPGFVNGSTYLSNFTGLTRLVDCVSTVCSCNLSPGQLDTQCFHFQTVSIGPPPFFLPVEGHCNGRPIRVDSGDGAYCTCRQADVGNECGSGSNVSTTCDVELGVCDCIDAEDQPICDEGWTGSACSTRTCANPLTGEPCSGAGTCVANICQCHKTRTGPTCRGDAGATLPAFCRNSTCNPQTNGLLDSCDHACDDQFLQQQGDCAYITDSYPTFPLVRTFCEEAYSPHVSGHGYCDWDNTANVTCQLGASLTIHNTRLMDCVGPTTCNCLPSPYLMYDSGCRQITCVRNAQDEASGVRGRCTLVTGGKCPITGCTDCDNFVDSFFFEDQGGPFPVQVNRYSGSFCCVNAWTSTNHTARTPCGARGSCGRDSECICTTGLGGKYCCPIASNQLSACGIHGSCTEDGSCLCDSGWTGSTCQTDVRCGGGCNTGYCQNGNIIGDALGRLHMELDASYLAANLWLLFELDLPVLSAPWVAQISLQDGGIDQVQTIVTEDSISFVAIYNAMRVREILLGFDFNDVAHRARYLIDCYGTPLNFSSSLFDSILGLSALPVYRGIWRNNGATSSTSAINTAFTRAHPGVIFDNTYFTAITNAIDNVHATDMSVAYALSALLVYEVLQDGNGVVVYPSPGISEICICPPDAPGPQCDLACPVGTNGQMCSGFEGGMRLGSCDSDTDQCVCVSYRKGIACEVDTLGLCVEDHIHGTPMCQGKGTCTAGTPYHCVCQSDWTGLFCNVSVCALAATPRPNDTTIECSNHGTCETTGCACFDLVDSGSLSIVPLLPIGESCENNGATLCATFIAGAWSECSGHGTCDTHGAGCVCDNGFSGAHCNISICGSPGCNDHETCNEGTGLCGCRSKYSTTSCPSGNITCRCQNSLCGHGNATASGTSCTCDANYRVDTSGICSIIQCPLIMMTDYGEVRCNGTEPLCNTTESTALGSHRSRCCYDACVSSGGVTQCTLPGGVPTCACSTANFIQSLGVCYSKCHGHPITGSTCQCSTSFPLYPPMDTVHEYLSIAPDPCVRVTCLNGGVVAGSGQSCVCPTFFSGPTCAIFTAPSGYISSSSARSSSAGIRSSSSSASSHSSSSTGGSSTVVATGYLSSSSSTGEAATEASSSSTGEEEESSSSTSVAVVAIVSIPVEASTTTTIAVAAGVVGGVIVVGGALAIYSASSAAAAAGSSSLLYSTVAATSL